MTARSLRRWVVPISLLALLSAAIIGLVMTRSDQPAIAARRYASLVDQRPLQTARSMSALASGR